MRAFSQDPFTSNGLNGDGWPAPHRLGNTWRVRYRVGIRWWLAGIFVLIAILTAALVATVSSRQADNAVRSNSEALAVGKTVSAGFSIERAIADGTLSSQLPAIAQSRNLALYVFDRRGRLLSSPRSLGISWRSVPNGPGALAAALADHRFVDTSKKTGATLAALPLRRSAPAHALVAYARRPAAYGRSLSIFRREALRAALWAVLVAAIAGLLAASLIARRLRRIDTAAAAIEQGDFSVALRPGFPDEVGSLAQRIDHMRRRLGESFDKLRAERDRLGRLLEQLQEGVVGVDTHLVVRVANARARESFGTRLQSGAALPELWPDFSLRDFVERLFRKDAVVAEARVDTEDGRAFSLVGVPAGSSELAVIVLTDITEQERRERAEREFVANASHELRTPVSAITSAVEALQLGAAEVQAERDLFIDLIGRQAARLGRLTRSLLILARAQTREEPVHLEPVHLRPLFDEIVASSPAAGSVDVTVECPADLTALAQRDIAEQVLSNLLGNALKYTTDGSVGLSARSEGDTVVIEVTDTGPGMSLAAEHSAFDRFYTGGNGRREGFGLGLAIVRDAVRALGGSVEIESAPGRGTTARVILAGVTRR